MSRPDSSSEAERLYVEFLRRQDAGEEVSIEAWCRENPTAAEALRRMESDRHAIANEIEKLLPAAKREISFFGHRERLARHELGETVRPGQVIGDHRLLRFIDSGGMGQVWEAEQVSLRRRVALKLVRPDRVSERALELFAREARAGGRLAHPGIVSVYAHGQNDGLAWIATELVEGSWTLRDFLDEIVREVEAPENYDRSVARLVAEIAEAMEAAHRASVIHRDIKPQNVLITRQDHPKVTDFGLARITDETAITQTGDFAGTYFYMSPEQVAAKRMGIDHRTDIFSLGVVMYELLALQRPFVGDTTHQVAEQIVTKEPRDLRSIRSRIPRDLAVICTKALEKDRDKRFQTMDAFAADLRRYLADEPIHSRPPTPWERAIKWTRRNPTKSVAAAIVTMAFAVISLLLLENLRYNAQLREANEALATKTTESENRRREVEAKETARKRAEETGDEALRQLFESHKRRLELAGRQGRWEEALATLEEVRAIGFPDELELDLRRARALVALSRRQEAEELLIHLEANPEITPRLGEVLLLEGDLALGKWEDQERALDLVRRALESEGLSAADREFAQGLLQSSVEEALAAFERARTHDPLHHHALSYSLLLTSLTGRHAEALAQAQAFEALYPEDPTGSIAKAAVLALQGDDEGARTVVERARERGLPKMEAVDSMLDLVRHMRIYDSSRLIGAEGNYPNFDALSGTVKQMTSRSGFEALQQIAPNLPCLSGSWGLFFEGMREMTGLGPDNILARARAVLARPNKGSLDLAMNDIARARDLFAKAAKANPDALFLFFEAGCGMMLISGREQWPERLREVEALFRRAGTTYSLVPGIKRASRHFAIQAQAAVFRLTGDGVMQQRAFEGLREFLGLSDLAIEECKTLLEVAERLDETRETLIVEAFLERWRELAPDDLQPLEGELRISLDRERHAESVALADRILALDPDHGFAREARARAIQGAADLAIRLEDQ